MNPASGMREDTLKVGLLMESAQAHQAMVSENLQRLQSHIRDLDTVVRDEIRRTFVEEFQALSAEGKMAAQALRAAGRQAHARLAGIGFALVLLVVAIVAGLVATMVPSPAQLLALRSQRAELELSLAGLRQQGALAEWRLCGDAHRLCVRVDRKAPGYGDQGDYWVVKGY